MPRFDMPGRDGEARRICMYRDGREYVFPLPYQTEDPREVRMLREQGCLVVPGPKRAPAPPAEPTPVPPEPEDKPKTRKGGDA